MTRYHTGAQEGLAGPATAAARRSCVTGRHGGPRAVLWFPAVDLAAPRCLRPYVLANSSSTAGKPSPANVRCLGRSLEPDAPPRLSCVTGGPSAVRAPCG